MKNIGYTKKKSKNFASKKIWVQKKNIWAPKKHLGPKKTFGSKKKFGSQNNLGLEKNWFIKTFGSKQLRALKNFGS